MHNSICAFPSLALYGNKLVSDSSVAEHLLIDLVDETSRDDSDYSDILGAPVIFFDTSGCEYFEKSSSENDEGSKYNENEATIVRVWLESLVCK
jgi:DNA polymerase alpha-associated DNA helicase A